MSEEWESAIPAESSGTAAVDFKKARKKKATLQDPLVKDTRPPHSIEAEQGVLGCVIASDKPYEVINKCVEKLQSSEVFYDLRHRAIYEAMVWMWDRKEPVDLITLQATLRDLLQLESVGGLSYLASLPDAVPSAANIDYYLEIVREKFVLRQMIGTCTEVVGRAYENQGKVIEILEEFQHDATALANLITAKTGLTTPKALSESGMKRLEEISALGGKPEGISTGFFDIDKITSGLKDQEMIVIAARPSVGKSAIALNIAEFVSVGLKIPTAVFSLEMSSVSLMMRALCSRAKVSMRDIRNGVVTPEEVQRLMQAKAEFAESPLYVDDEGGLSLAKLRAKARRYSQQYGIRLGIVDYLQLLHSNRRSGNRQEEVGEISRGIKAIAKELNIPIVVLAQLNREIDKDKQRKPKMSDLRESGAIEQDADIIALLYKKPTPEGEIENLSAPCIPVNLLIAKNRNGEIDDIPLTFFRRYTKFESVAKEELSNYPQPDNLIVI